ncbi:MAG: permease [Thermotaleaceae bacterium]
MLQNSILEGFSTIFLSIILEAIPFVMIGAFVSSLIQIFVSEETITRIIPKNRFLGLIAAALMGFIFPVCECAIVPIMRRLIKKGVPLHIAIAFMVAVPIVNPVVLTSTYYAFSGQLHMVLLRGWLGFMSAIFIGHVIGLWEGKNNPMKEQPSMVYSGCGCGHEEHHHDHSCCGHHGEEGIIDLMDDAVVHHHVHSHGKKKGLLGKIVEMMEHTSLELYDVGKYLIMGAFISSLMQTFVERNYLVSIGQGQFSSIAVMLVLAFILSLCSEADAFIARTFLGQFTTGSILGFLIFGPMSDIKNTMMLLGTFKKGFVIRLTILMFSVCFALAMVINFAGL